jgi:hypothetical protein
MPKLQNADAIQSFMHFCIETIHVFNMQNLSDQTMAGRMAKTRQMLERMFWMLENSQGNATSISCK